MDLQATIDRFEGDKAVLVFNDGVVVLWPKAKVPAGISEGSTLFISLKDREEAETEKRTAAKNILNEILDAEQEE